MKRFFQNRYLVLGATIAFLFVVLVIRLFDLQWQNGAEYAASAAQGLEKYLRITGSRGKIFDRNGVPLAYDQNSYTVVFYKDPSHSLASTYSTDDDGNKTTYAQHYTEVIRKTIDIIEVNGGTPNSSFNIRYDGEKGDFVYDFNTGDPAVFQRRLELWLKNMSIPESRRSYTPKEMYWYLMDRYGVPFDVAFEEARQVLSVWQQVQMSSYRSYNPVEVAKSVNMDTVAAIEMKSIELDGMQIRESNVRVYPKKTLAAHIIGYMGRMLDEGTIIEMKEVGYTQEDLIGIYGIEATMEYELSANLDSRTGTRVVEVNSRGKIISEVSVTAPKDGNSVVLTIDTGLQKKAEDALEQNIKEIQSVQQSQYNQNKEEYDREIRERGGAPIKFAEVGAAVVMQVQTGEVLALTSEHIHGRSYQ